MKHRMQSLSVLGLALCSLLSSAGCQRALAGQPSNVQTYQAPAPIYVIALAKVKAGDEERFRAEALSILAPTRAEAGNVSYDFHQSSTDPTEFATYEEWDSQAAIDAHMQAPHMLRFFAGVGALFAPGFPQIKEYQRLIAP